MNTALCAASFAIRVLLCASTIGWVTTSARALVIDDFSQGALSIQATNFAGVTVLQTGLDPSSVLGGTRSAYDGSLALGSFTIDTSKGRFNYTADVSFGYFKLGWGTVTPLNVDLTAGKNKLFALDFVDVTPGVQPAFLELSIKSGGWYTYDFSADLFNATSSQTFGTLTIPFSKFAGADLTQVQAIEIYAARIPPGMHLSFDALKAVPEPAISSLLLPGLAFLLASRRAQP